MAENDIEVHPIREREQMHVRLRLARGGIGRSEHLRGGADKIGVVSHGRLQADGRPDRTRRVFSDRQFKLFRPGLRRVNLRSPDAVTLRFTFHPRECAHTRGPPPKHAKTPHSQISRLDHPR